jgi:Cu(I)/Ag(I) efflux system protein CusF
MKVSTMIGIALLSLNPMAFGHEHHSTLEKQTMIIHATGTIKAIADTQERIRIFHNPITLLGWGAMNMPFEVKNHDLLKGLSIGDNVDFDFVQESSGDTLVGITKR